MRWDVVERDGTTLALEDRWKGFTDEVLKRMEEARTTEDAMEIWKIVVIGSGGYRDARKSLVTLPQSTSICLLHKHLSRTTRTGTTQISYFINLK